jgi:twinkle protein
LAIWNWSGFVLDSAASDSTFVCHVPCEKCGSSDAGALYTDGHVFCHKCEAYYHQQGEPPERNERPRVADLIEDFVVKAIDSRRLSEDTCRKFNYGVVPGKLHVANYCTPEGQVVAQKLRYPNKDFRFIGDTDATGLYGQHLWRDGGKKIVVTEGEIDAMSVSQAQGNKWPVVSVPTGAKGARKALAKQIEWLERFEEIILMFDMDDDGRAAVEACADLFKPGKVKVAELPLKDANEMLKAGRSAEIINAIWQARTHRPDGIVAGTELWDRILATPDDDHVPYPWQCMNDKLLGVRREIVMITAGTGTGKTTLVHEIQHSMLTAGESLGLIHLEESVEETAMHLMSIELNHRLLLDRKSVPVEKQKEAFDKTVGSGRIYLYDHWGSADSDELFSKIRYFVHGCGCSTIFLDHISIATAGQDTSEVDALMAKLGSLVKELKVRLVVICHLKKNDGTAFEEGAQISLDDLRGSGAIKQVSYDIIALERNQQDENHSTRVNVRVLKCRRTGRTGLAGTLEYNVNTGRLTEVDIFDDAPVTTNQKKDSPF